MQNREKTKHNRVHRYLDDVFANVGESQQLYDLKEELATNMKEKIADYKIRGLDEDQAFKEAAASMGDLTGLVEDMRKAGQDETKQTVYSSWTNRIGATGIVIGSLLILFGLLTPLMLYFMNAPAVSVVGASIFAVAGGTVLTYGALTMETKKKFAMNRIRALLYASAVGLVLFGIFAAGTSGFATNEAFIAVASSMSFLLGGVGLFLALFFTGNDRRKKQ
ncbi:hypothetical protein JSY36_10355 [Bacillus sp. H-16]|uniref:permease prefix domain 1-containing protein n=1 Tax=Alteribacter salitolerans TaxID=2912333 RepID=UPI0019637252|nr:permease prefix domain 1-containing protein [Alteribacter salitolerans]MBM7096159.1 hypothetical protein [Alteribacter salitolerans]